MSVEQLLSEPRLSRPENRLVDNTVTWLAEVLNGSMRTSFEFTYDGEHLYSQNGEVLGPIFTRAIKEAENITQNKPNLAFELRRRLIEGDEHSDMLRMARGELPNTMVVVSDFPMELTNTTEDIGGYNTARKQTMLRVITQDRNGKLQISSQSLDGSDRQSLEAIYGFLGFVPSDGELLGQRINVELGKNEQDMLIDKLVDVYDKSMTSRFGGSYYAGIYKGKPDNTYDFVIKQQDLLDIFIKSYSSNMDAKLLYNLAATMKQRFENQAIIVPREGLPTEQFAVLEMHRAGETARVNGQVFSGCGMSIGLPDASNTDNELFGLGYGNKTSSETEYSFNKYMYCVVCQSPPQEDEPKKMCGPCGICRSCDTKLKK